MAEIVDKTIGDLPAASAIYDDDLFLLEQSGEAKNLRGALYKAYLQGFVDAASAASQEAAAALAGVRDAINNIPDGAATPIVNDLTTGGTSMALSAEMGKVLKGELDGLTPEDIGAVPIIDARSATYDMDMILKSGRHLGMYETSSATLGTPYAKGVTPSASSTILSYANNAEYGCQIAFLSANIPYVRYLSRVSGITPWVSLATTNYAVNKAGDTMTGDLKIVKSSFGGVNITNSTAGTEGQVRVHTNGHVYLRQTVTQDDGTTTNKGVWLYNRNVDNSLQYEHLGSFYNILHTGNKPSGSYTGNGSAASRTINVGGIGSCLVIYGYGGFALVTYQGTVVVNGSTASVSVLYSTQCKYQNGVLTLATDNAVVNNNETTMYYQVL